MHSMRIVRLSHGLALTAFVLYNLMAPSLTAPVSSKAKMPTVELPDYDPKNFEGLDTIVGSARMVNFGEAAHRMIGMHLAATRMFRYLVESKGFRVFVFESAWRVDEVARDFLASNRTALLSNETFFFNAFNSKYTTELLLWSREFNRLNPNDTIRFAGYQPEQPVTDMNALWTLMGKSSKFSAATFRPQLEPCKVLSSNRTSDIDFIIFINQLLQNGQPSYTKEQRSACNAGLNATDKFIEDNRQELIAKTSPVIHREAQAHLISFRSYLNTLMAVSDNLTLTKNISEAQTLEQGHIIYEEGDLARFEIFNILTETRYKDKKAMFWMHNWHAMKNSPDVTFLGGIPNDTISLGTRLARLHCATDYVVIGSVVGCPQCVKPLREDAFERSFARVLGNKSAIVNMIDVAPQYQNLPFTTPGSLLEQKSGSAIVDVILDLQFDAICYLPRSEYIS